METFISFLIASAVTLFFVRRYVKKLAAKEQGAGGLGGSVGGGSAGGSTPAATPAAMGAPCPRCNKPVTPGAAFCPACGAPLALWNVHRASVQNRPVQPGEKGKPRPAINATLCIGCGSCVDECPETGTLALASGKAILAHPERCTGHAKCVEVCPTSAIVLTFAGVLQTLRVPNVNEFFETNLSGVFIVGELGGMGLIKTAINEGKLAIENVRRRLEDAGLWKPPVIDHNFDENAASREPAPVAAERNGTGPYDVVIAGAGPAGLSAALTAHQYGLKYITLEQGEIAATIRNYPRHKFLMAEPLEMPLYGNLYIGDSTKEALLAVWETIVKNTGVRVRTQERVESLAREEGGFQVNTPAGSYQTRYVVLALGKRGTPRRLGVPGEELSKVVYRLIEAESYSDDDILIVGGGDSAVEAALAVSQNGRNRVTLSYRGGDFARVKERNQQRLGKAESEGRVRVLRNSQVREILPDAVRLTAKGETLEIPNRYVFVLIGGESPEEFLRKTGIDIVEKVIT